MVASDKEKPDVTLIWQKNVHAGYDPETKRWRLRDGQFASRHEVLGQINPAGVYGDVVHGSITPLSDKLDRFERIVLQGLDYASLHDRMKEYEEKHADTIPPDILAAMQLSEYYLNAEGDLWNTVIVPIQLALRDIQVESSDKKVQEEIEETYKRIKMDELLEWIWLSVETYGNAYPLEVWEGSDLVGVVLLNPKYMRVGRQISLMPQLFLTPGTDYKWGGEGWSEEALKSQIHPMVYHSFASGWNEQAAKGNDIPLDINRCHQANHFKMPWQRYAIPPCARCFRPLSTRQIVEEMQRATFEGFRNQLWKFTVGTDDAPATPAELTHLGSVVSGKMTGQRTGCVVWNHTLNVEVLAPATLDGVLGNEAWLANTLHIYRQRGLSLKIITGESPGQRGTDIEWDVEVFIERMKYPRRGLLSWEAHIRRSIAAAKGGAFQKAKTRSYMLLPDLQTKTLVRDQLQPLRMMGLLSVRTMLEKLGYDYETELERKKKEEPDIQHWMAQPSFSQSAIPSGSPPSVTVSQSPGRPPGTQEDKPRDVEAALLPDATFDTYVYEVYEAFDRMVANPTHAAVDQFIADLEALNREYMYDFGEAGYLAGGGAHELDEAWIDGSINYVNSYADGFGDRLKSAIDAGEDLENYRWNAYLYPQEGRHLAYMWGVQQAMRERGANGWRRILHPERSETGPCAACIADSQIVHPITEGFWEPHPNGVCTAQAVAYYVHPTLPIAEIPVPTKVVLPDVIRKIIERLGKIGRVIIRRIRKE